MRLLRQPAFLAVALGHFGVDLLNSQVTLLLAVLSGPLHLSNADIGLVATLYALLSSGLQPFFGWLVDRLGGRWSAAGGVLWMAALFSLMAVGPSRWSLVCLLLCPIGSAAFHPPGAMKVTELGELHLAGQAATAASVFFLFGQGGSSLGPLSGGFLLEHAGRPGLLLFSALVLPAGWLLFQHFNRLTIVRRVAHSPIGRAASFVSGRQVFIVALSLATMRSWAQVTTMTFLPKFLQDQGMTPTAYGVILAFFMLGIAAGGVAGGLMANWWGEKFTVTLSLSASIVSFYLLPLMREPWLYLVVIVAGVLNGMPHSILLTIAQRAMPGRVGLASGLILGLMFSLGALGAYVGGLAADVIGLVGVLQLSSGVCMLAALVSLILRSPRLKGEPA
jgi:MFS transporter, FSR family, fosmidomycin resistance protein